MLFVDTNCKVEKSERFLQLMVDKYEVSFYAIKDSVYVVVSNKNNEAFISTVYDTIEHFNSEQWDEHTLANAMRNYIASHKNASKEYARLDCVDFDGYVALIGIEGGEKQLPRKLLETPAGDVCEFFFEIKTPSFFKAMKQGISPYDEKYTVCVRKNYDGTISPVITWHDTSVLLKSLDIDKIASNLLSILEYEKNSDGIYKVSRGYGAGGCKIRDAINIGSKEFEKSVELLVKNPTVEGVVEFRASLESNRIATSREWLANKHSVEVSKDGFEIGDSTPYDQLPGNAVVYVAKEDTRLEGNKFYANKVYTKRDFGKKCELDEFIKNNSNLKKEDKSYDLQEK